MKESRRNSPDAETRARSGLLLGLFVAAVFSLLSTTIWLWNGRSFGYLDITLSEMILIYLAWAVPVGMVAGLLVPVTRNGWGAAGLGGFMMASAYLIGGFIRGATLLEFSIGVLLGLGVGGVFGYRLFPRYWAWSDRTE